MIKKGKVIIFLGLLFLVQTSIGQNEKYHRIALDNPFVELPLVENVQARIDLPLHEKSILAFLGESYPWLFLNGSSLVLQEQTESPFTTHFLFQQQFHGMEVYGNYLKVNLEKNGQIINVIHNTCATESWSIDLIMEKAFEEAGDISMIDYLVDEIIYRSIDGPTFGKLIRVNTNDARSDIKDYSTTYLMNKSDLLWKSDLHAYFAHDTIIKAYIFQPDPLTSAATVYGGMYVDNFDSTNVSLDDQRILVTITATDTLDTFYVKNPYCAITDFASPFKAVVTQSNDSFLFTRYDDAFEDVNAFYHINMIHQYVNDSLGFSVVNYPIMVDPHGAGGADNSFFSYSTSPPSLQFGEGGVDDAEDADVVVHEYGHAISFAAAPLTNTGRERNAIDEGFCDYLATSYSKALYAYHSDSMFTWDGHNEFWQGRVANSTRRYNKNDSTGSYINGGIWCSALVEIEGKLGRAKTNQLAIQTMYFEASNTKMPYAAQMLLKADTILFGGVDYCKIVHSLYARNLLDKKYIHFCDFTAISPVEMQQEDFLILNEAGFASGKEDLIVVNKKEQKIEINLFAINGELIYSNHSTALNNILSPVSLASGFYLLQIKSDRHLMNQKLLKY